MNLSLKKIIKKYGNLSILVKIIISSTIGIFAGASFIGFISEYATYSYAVQYGVRVPVEGVPYLPMTITIISIIMLIASVSLFFILLFYYKIISLIFRNSSKYFGDSIKEYLVPERTLKSTKKSKGAIIFSSISSNLIIFSLLGVALPSRFHIITYLLFVIFTIYLISIVSYFISASENIKNWILISLIFIQVLLISISLFNTNVYGKILRLTKLGGGIEITVYADNKNILYGNLFMVTKEKYIIYKKKDKLYAEIPKKNVYKITYQPNSSWYLKGI